MAPKRTNRGRAAREAVSRSSNQARPAGSSIGDDAGGAERAFVFCLRADGTPFRLGNVGRVCAGWLCAMYPTEAPPPGVWVQVPGELLPEGAAVAYFNGRAFLEDAFPRGVDRSEDTMESRSEAGGWTVARVNAAVMLQEFRATGAHYSETLRSEFPVFRGSPPQGHPYPEAWEQPRSSCAPFSGQGARLCD